MKTIDDGERVTTVKRSGRLLNVRYACGHTVQLVAQAMSPRWRLAARGVVVSAYAETAAAIERADVDAKATTLLLRGIPDCPDCDERIPPHRRAAFGLRPPVGADPGPAHPPLPEVVPEGDDFVVTVAMASEPWKAFVRDAGDAWVAQYRFERGGDCILVRAGGLYTWNHRTWFGARAAMQTELGLPAGRIDAVGLGASRAATRLGANVVPRCGMLVRDVVASMRGSGLAGLNRTDDKPVLDQPVLEQALANLRAASPEYINDLAVKAGVYTKAGKLTKAFGGKAAGKR